MQNLFDNEVDDEFEEYLNNLPVPVLQKSNVILSPSQQLVVNEFPRFLLDDSKEMTISGFAGSGKSFLVKYLADMGERQQKLVRLTDATIPWRRLWFTATTNKAAEVLKNFLGREVSTIHSLMGLTVKNDYHTGKQVLVPKGMNKATNLNNSIIFIDEASMVNVELLKIIRETAAKFTDCKIIFIGDSYQLPPVMEDMCPVFKPGNKTYFLKEIQRQAAGSPIIQLSGEYRKMLDDHTLEWPVIPTHDPRIIVYGEQATFLTEIAKQFVQPHAPDDLKIVAWSNKRVTEYNNFVRKILGKTKDFELYENVVTNKPLMLSDERIVAQTDSVLTVKDVWQNTQNLLPGYSIELYELPGDVFFQPASVIAAANLAKELAKKSKLDRNWKPYFEVQQQWADLRPIHASTVHKAQGSSYKQVFVDLDNISINNSWREVARLVYVAITRASDVVHIYGKLSERYNKKAVIDLMEPFKNVDCL